MSKRELVENYTDLLGYQMPALSQVKYFEQCAQIAIEHAASEAEAWDRWKVLNGIKSCWGFANNRVEYYNSDGGSFKSFTDLYEQFKNR